MAILAAQMKVKREAAKKALEAKQAEQRAAAAKNPMKPASPIIPKLDLPAPINSLSEIPLAAEAASAPAVPVLVPPAITAPVQPSAVESAEASSPFDDKTIVEGVVALTAEDYQQLAAAAAAASRAEIGPLLGKVDTGGGERDRTPSSVNKTVQFDEDGAAELLEQIRLRREQLAASAAPGAASGLQPAQPVRPEHNIVVGADAWSADDVAPAFEEDEGINLAGKLLRETPIAGRLPSHKLVTLADDEYVIALSKPSTFFWLSIAIACLFVVTIPLAIWMLLHTGGQFWITTKRSLVLPIVGSNVRALEHEHLAAIESGSVWLAGPQRTLNLKPFDKAKVKPLSFSYCSSSDLVALWGTLVFWRMPQCDIFRAPPVDRDGHLLDARTDLGILVLDDVELAQKNGDLSGPCIVSPDELTIYKGAAEKGATGLGPRLPIYHLLYGLAQDATSLAAFQIELRELLGNRLIRKAWSTTWSENPARELSGSGKLLLTSSTGRKTSVNIPKGQVLSLRSYLQQLGLLA